ncbi:MAG: asparagine synthase (glutamine-hydrolyzing) [Bacteroidota bacterium]
MRSMLMQIQYRGPDESGIYIGDGIGMGSVRLSIIDLEQGQQPMCTPEEDLWIVYNGEIFNYIELREELKKLGYRFRTKSDTEVLLILYRHYREKCLEKLNGQYAFAIWDTHRRELFMARDRMGIRPLYYCDTGNDFIFGSEIKCILESNAVRPEFDPVTLNQVLTFWSIPSPGTLFRKIYELPPGHCLLKGKGDLVIKPYWNLEFRINEKYKDLNDAKEAFNDLISDAVRIRLRSDVQVAAYLSGGIDSSATTYYIKKADPGVLNTFSIGFEDAEFDETPYQEKVSKWLDTRHRSVSCRNSDIASNFAEVIWHTEVPILRTAAVPMFLLSRLVHDHDIKVVITGEGADEFLGGYNIFKEALIREFWSRQPDSGIRPLLLSKLYPYLAQFQGRNTRMLKMFFGHRLTETDSPIYSHLVRWNNSSHVRNHLHPDVLASIGKDPVHMFQKQLLSGLEKWGMLEKAQWIEATLFLSGYLLSSQGDRVAMAHSVEGRYPFLDHRVIEFCTGLRSDHKIKGLNEKYLLKNLMQKKLPDEVISRPKQAYRAPVASSLLSENAPGYFRELLSSSRLARHGFFRADTVEKLVAKLDSGKTITENDNMAVSGILSTQILADLFLSGNNPFRIHGMRTECPVRYDKVVQNHI